MIGPILYCLYIRFLCCELTVVAFMYSMYVCARVCMCACACASSVFFYESLYCIDIQDNGARYLCNNYNLVCILFMNNINKTYLFVVTSKIADRQRICVPLQYKYVLSLRATVILC